MGFPSPQLDYANALIDAAREIDDEYLEALAKLVERRLTKWIPA